MQCSWAILSSTACLALQYISILSHKCHDFRKNLFWTKTWVLIFWFSVPTAQKTRCHIITNTMLLMLIRHTKAVDCKTHTETRILCLGGAFKRYCIYRHSASKATAYRSCDSSRILHNSWLSTHLGSCVCVCVCVCVYIYIYECLKHFSF